MTQWHITFIATTVILSFTAMRADAVGAMAPVMDKDGPPARSLEEMQISIEARIEVMQRVADLSDEQAAKVRVAAETAAKQIFADPKEYGIVFGKVKALNLARKAVLQPADKEPSLSDEDAESTAPPNIEVVEIDIPLEVPVRMVLDHDIWKKSQLSVLTAPQAEAVNDYWQKQRQESETTGAIETIVNILDEILVLTPEQNERITALIRRRLQVHIGSLPDAAFVDHTAIDAATRVEIKSLLSPLQIEEMDRLFSEADRFRIYEFQQLQMYLNELYPLDFAPGPVAASPDEMEQIVALYIDAMVRALDLDADQVAELRRGARQAATEMFADPDKFALPYRRGNEIVPQRTLAGQPEANQFQPVLPVHVLMQHARWTTAETNCLSAEQRKRCEDYWQHREQAKRAAGVARKVNRIAQLLFLSDKQGEQVRVVIDEIYGPHQEWLGFLSLMPGFVGRARPFSPDEFDEILSPTQQQYFEFALGRGF